MEQHDDFNKPTSVFCFEKMVIYNKFRKNECKKINYLVRVHVLFKTKQIITFIAYN